MSEVGVELPEPEVTEDDEESALEILCSYGDWVGDDKSNAAALAEVSQLYASKRISKELIHELETNLKFECEKYRKGITTLQAINADSHERIGNLESAVRELATVLNGEHAEYPRKIWQDSKRSALAAPIVVELLKGE